MIRLEWEIVITEIFWDIRIFILHVRRRRLVNWWMISHFFHRFFWIQHCDRTIFEFCVFQQTYINISLHTEITAQCNDEKFHVLTTEIDLKILKILRLRNNNCNRVWVEWNYYRIISWALLMGWGDEIEGEQQPSYTRLIVFT